MEIKNCKPGQLIYRAHNLQRKIIVEVHEVFMRGIYSVFTMAVRGGEDYWYTVGHEYAVNPESWYDSEKEALQQLKADMVKDIKAMEEGIDENHKRICNIDKMLKEIDT